jgi:hypothetical protein
MRGVDSCSYSVSQSVCGVAALQGMDGTALFSTEHMSAHNNFVKRWRVDMCVKHFMSQMQS